jgi:hypothetical protein
MSDDLYFDGDPAEDSRRRHLERVIKGGRPRRRWPWIAAAVAGGAWTIWRMTHPPAAPPAGTEPDDGKKPDAARGEGPGRVRR